MSEAEPQQQLEAKLIYADRRVWKAIERIAAGERRSWRQQATILLERAIADRRETVAEIA
jgi:hypothetical protein